MEWSHQPPASHHNQISLILDVFTHVCYPSILEAEGEDCHWFKAGLSYIVSSRLAWAQVKPWLKPTPTLSTKLQNLPQSIIFFPSYTQLTSNIALYSVSGERIILSFLVHHYGKSAPLQLLCLPSPTSSLFIKQLTRIILTVLHPYFRQTDRQTPASWFLEKQNRI